MVLSLPATKLLFYRKILVNPKSTTSLKARRVLGATRDKPYAGQFYEIFSQASPPALF